MTKKIILLDIDGTIMDSAEGIIDSMCYSFVNNGIPADRKVLETFVGPPFSESLGKMGIVGDRAKKIIDDYRHAYSNSVNGKKPGIQVATFFEGMKEFAPEMAEKGFIVMTASTKPISAAKLMFDHFGITNDYAGIFASDYEKKIIYKKDVIKNALDSQDFNPQVDKAAMVGDRIYDINGAKKVGIYSIGVRWGYSQGEELSDANPDAIVKSVSELKNTIYRYFDE
jgi:phosphoglycolate phosphatase